MSLDPRTLEGQMRELLAQEYERETGHKDAEFIRLTKYRGVVSVDLAVAAMVLAYRAGFALEDGTPDGAVLAPLAGKAINIFDAAVAPKRQFKPK